MSADISAESSPRSDQSADKSGDSGISGDHAHSDHRVDSPRIHVSTSKQVDFIYGSMFLCTRFARNTYCLET